MYFYFLVFDVVFCSHYAYFDVVFLSFYCYRDIFPFLFFFGACMYMPHNGYWPASSFEFITPPPKTVSSSAAKKLKIPRAKLLLLL